MRFLPSYRISLCINHNVSTSFWSMEMSNNQLGSLMRRLFSKFCIAQSWAWVENNGNEQEQGIMGRQNIIIIIFFPFRFLLCLPLLDNQIKYPENHRERLRTRQVNCILIMKSSNIFREQAFEQRWQNTSSVQNHFYGDWKMSVWFRKNCIETPQVMKMQNDIRWISDDME